MAFYGDTDNQGYNYNFVPIPVAYGSGECDYSYRDSPFSTPSQFNYYSEPTEYRYSFNHYESSANLVPKFLQHEPPPPDRGTKFIISYSTASEFNEPEFEEFDPTPYDGGYDIATTYGKPLAPSDLICYPRSVPQSVPLDSFSYGSSTHGKAKGDDDVIPLITPPNVPTPLDTAKTGLETETEMSGDGVESENEDNEYERPMVQIPYGSGLESMDLCESLFGYWPCLAKIEREERAKYLQDCEQNNRMDPWNTAADYLFGGYTSENYHQWQQEA